MVFYDKQAEFTRILSKGSYAMVLGTARMREYERDGAKPPTSKFARAGSASLISRNAAKTRA